MTTGHRFWPPGNTRVPNITKTNERSRSGTLFSRVVQVPERLSLSAQMAVM